MTIWYSKLQHIYRVDAHINSWKRTWHISLYMHSTRAMWELCANTSSAADLCTCLPHIHTGLTSVAHTLQLCWQATWQRSLTHTLLLLHLQGTGHVNPAWQVQNYNTCSFLVYSLAHESHSSKFDARNRRNSFDMHLYSPLENDQYGRAKYLRNFPVWRHRGIWARDIPGEILTGGQLGVTNATASFPLLVTLFARCRNWDGKVQFQGAFITFTFQRLLNKNVTKS